MVSFVEKNGFETLKNSEIWKKFQSFWELLRALQTFWNT